MSARTRQWFTRLGGIGLAAIAALACGAPERGDGVEGHEAAVVDGEGASPGKWSYVPLSDFICANGKSSGVAVNPSPDPDAPVVVFLMGGGACWGPVTCLAPTASNLTTTVGEAEVLADVKRVSTLFERDAEANPFRKASYVLVPYCTGDLDIGDSVRTYGPPGKRVTIHHHGAKNTDAVIAKSKELFPDAPRVFVTGASGGGYAALLNAHRFKTAWPSARIDILDDSGPPINPAGTTWQEMQEAWRPQLPPGCTDCGEDITSLLPHLAATMPDSRIGIMSYRTDKTIKQFTTRFFDFDFENQLDALRRKAGPNQKFFFVDGDKHVLLKQKPEPVSRKSNVRMTTWLQRFVDGDPRWTHEGE